MTNTISAILSPDEVMQALANYVMTKKMPSYHGLASIEMMTCHETNEVSSKITQYRFVVTMLDRKEEEAFH